MTVSKCRVCGQKFFNEPLLRYNNMPKAAQFMPDGDALVNDIGVDLEVYQCSGCGLVQLDADPVPYYKEVIRASAISKEMKSFRKRQFNGFVRKNCLENKKVIEIGCGRGEYLSLIRECNVDAYGLEHSGESVKYCIENGLKVFRGFTENSTDRLIDGPFDAFFILSFLEHLPDPNSSLTGIFNNLTDDAVGLVEVPNFDMICRKNLFSEFIGDHLFYFTKESLKSALNQNGFEIIECCEVWHNYIISATVKKRKKLDLSRFYEYQEQLKGGIEEFINRHKNVAVWGAGHQALAVISLSNLADKIKYVVDSAEFKQGKYTPATHVPIVSPERLNSDPVNAVIVMAAAYSDEVARTIRRKYDRNLSVAILRDSGLEEISSPEME
jgi:SAM-dependent methyltransferase